MPLFPSTPADVLESHYECSAPVLSALPEPGDPEIAFAGRSNVGKSSIINALLRRRDLARTSSTPGKTRALNLYTCRVRTGQGEGRLRLVDLPGYGYARVARQERSQWEGLVEGYLRTRPVLWGVVLIIDGRRPPAESDLQMAGWLASVALPWGAVLTKSDKITRGGRQKVHRQAEGPLRSLGARGVLTCSATSGEGIAALWPLIEDFRA